MPKLSTAGWIAHDLGLATAIGGSLFGKVAFDPSLRQIKNARWRDKVNEDAWGRYGPVSLAAHALIVLPWVAGRFMLSGKEVSSTARTLTRVKDVLVGVSVLTVAASALLGRLMARKKERDVGPEEARADNHRNAAEQKKVAIDYTLDAVSLVNLVANAGLVGVTAVLAMEGNQSKRFAREADDLP